MLRHRPSGHIQHSKSTSRLLVAALALNLTATSQTVFGDGWKSTTTTATAQASEPVPSSGHSVWHPRPLALPATSDTAIPWTPPERVVPTPAPTSTTIVIQPPAPALPPTPPPPAPEPEPEPPTPAEIRQQRLLQKRASAKRSAYEAAQQPDRPLPPPDEINLGSRKSQLAAAAVEQLRIAHWAAQRGATESAKQAATQTLRTIAALRDAQNGDNAYTTELNTAFVAIRESMDFSGRYGPVDTAAIGRLIEVHQTPVLKGVGTTHLTSARAVDAYLQFAQARLVNATSGGPLAAEATMILADLETLAANTGRSIDSPPEFSALHSSELALTYRRAAVEIAPQNADASADLGRTLLKRSIPNAAKELLLQSVRVAPTRQRVESLLEAAAKSGDFVLVDQCEKQLASQQLPSELPVRMMSPQEFARTGQNVPPAMASSVAATGVATNQGPPAQQYRVATRPTNTTGRGMRPSVNPPAQVGQIVDPTLPENWSPTPSASTAPTQPARRLFW
ncbi:hypothetical protein [Rhodopirellula sp. SWK7]|uniref:hypothetical protein n=1 Tax=Rhodopirellula sp. SWK7 TaxID=595460 RepID=UPI0011817A43|nr:hypothetical protein [Rhodopirellula sp. SWK7]